MFGQYTSLENLRCRPPITVSADIRPIKLRSVAGRKGGKADVRKASMTRRIHEDILLDEPQYKDMMERVVEMTTDLL